MSKLFILPDPVHVNLSSNVREPIKTVGHITYIVLVQTLNPAQSIKPGSPWLPGVAATSLPGLSITENIQKLCMYSWPSGGNYPLLKVLRKAATDRLVEQIMTVG